MKRFVIATILAVLLAGCGAVTVVHGDMTEDEFKALLQKHKIGRSSAVAVVKDSLGAESYLMTVHGFTDNSSVCRELVAPYNSGDVSAAVPGYYRCETLKP